MYFYEMLGLFHMTQFQNKPSWKPHWSNKRESRRVVTGRVRGPHFNGVASVDLYNTVTLTVMAVESLDRLFLDSQRRWWQATWLLLLQGEPKKHTLFS